MVTFVRRKTFQNAGRGERAGGSRFRRSRGGIDLSVAVYAFAKVCGTSRVTEALGK